MTFNTALTSPQKALLRSGGYAGDYLLYCFSNRVVFAGQFNSETTTIQTWASFAYNLVSVGAYTDVVVGQVCVPLKCGGGVGPLVGGGGLCNVGADESEGGKSLAV